MKSLQKAAVVALIGRPSVGKSTLLNLFCGAKVAIVSPVPQTTRNAVRGIRTEPRGQIVFVDTPGRHVSEKKLNKKLMDVADRALEDCDLVLYLLDASRAPGPEEEAVAERIKKFQGRTVAAINKTDAAAADSKKLHAFLDDFLPELSPLRRFEISCYKKEGIDALLSCLFDLAATGEPLYPAEYYTDQDIPFRISEIIREKAMNRLKQELPHSIYVEIADLELREESASEKQLWIRAFIIAERESQKGIIVGSGGEKIKAIRLAALKDLKRIFDWKIDLDLRVKTGKDWRGNDRVLKKIIG